MERNLKNINKYADNIKTQNPIVEGIYKLNIGFSLSEQESYDAMLSILAIENPLERSTFLGIILNGIMSKHPDVDELVGLLKATLTLDNLNLENIRQIEIAGEIVIGLAGSGKKGIKSNNISTCASFVAAAAGAFIIKPCSHATSSLTGSTDFVEKLGIKLKLDSEKTEQILRKTGLGFFSIEGQIQKFDSLYGGKFHAPHALSFALSALVLPIKPNLMFFGLSHPAVSTSVKVLDKFGYKNSFVVASTDNGLHYIDEVAVFGTTYICGNRNGKVGKINYIQPANELGLPRYSREDIKPGENIEENILLGLKVLQGIGDRAREDMVCVNSGTILYLAGKVKNLKEGYLLSKKVISEGKVIKKVKQLIIEIGGDMDIFNQLIK